MAFYVYDGDANAELSEHAVSVLELELDTERDWDIIDGPTELGTEGRDASVFQYRYRRLQGEQSHRDALGYGMASTEGLE